MTDTSNPSAAGADLLYGAHAIARYLGIKERAAYHLIETRRIPFFKIGKTLHQKLNGEELAPAKPRGRKKIALAIVFHETKTIPPRGGIFFVLGYKKT